MHPVIESVPNVSEGRRPEVVDELTDAFGAVAVSRLLDCSADPSHNRSVFTMVGAADALHAALLRLLELAVASALTFAPTAACIRA